MGSARSSAQLACTDSCRSSCAARWRHAGAMRAVRNRRDAHLRVGLIVRHKRAAQLRAQRRKHQPQQRHALCRHVRTWFRRVSTSQQPREHRRSRVRTQARTQRPHWWRGKASGLVLHQLQKSRHASPEPHAHEAVHQLSLHRVNQIFDQQSAVSNRQLATSSGGGSDDERSCGRAGAKQTEAQPGAQSRTYPT